MGNLLASQRRTGTARDWISRTRRVRDLRSANQPFVDDNPLCYLAADNPSFDWLDQYLDDVRHRQLPSYLDGMS